MKFYYNYVLCKNIKMAFCVYESIGNRSKRALGFVLCGWPQNTQPVIFGH
jgi:hypothetical protein